MAVKKKTKKTHTMSDGTVMAGTTHKPPKKRKKTPAKTNNNY
jgi:hypothetical protein